MDGEDVCKLFASDFGTVKVFAGESMINIFLSMMSDGVVSVSFCLSFWTKGGGFSLEKFHIRDKNKKKTHAFTKKLKRK